MNVMFTQMQVVPLAKTPAKVLIRWQVNAPPAELADLEFYVERSFGGGTMEAITQAIPALEPMWYVDFAAEIRSLNPRISYRVRARKISTQEEVFSHTAGLKGDLDIVGLYVVDEYNFYLEDVAGIPCLIYARRRGGIPCEKCFDPIQKKRTVSNCKACYSTNWKGGFYKPVEAYIEFSGSTPKETTMQQWGETQDNQTNLTLSNFPTLLPGDVIREMREGRMWRIVSVQETEKRRVPMTQAARAAEIKPGDIEYTIPVDEQALLKRVEELEATRTRREF